MRYNMKYNETDRNNARNPCAECAWIGFYVHFPEEKDARNIEMLIARSKYRNQKTTLAENHPFSDMSFSIVLSNITGYSLSSLSNYASSRFFFSIHSNIESQLRLRSFCIQVSERYRLLTLSLKEDSDLSRRERSYFHVIVAAAAVNSVCRNFCSS